jgi:Ca2+-binding RTX toxin-like protein
MATIIGTAAGEYLVGSSLGDSMSGLAGNDTLFGANGADTLDGGAGNDSLSGGAGIDTITYATATAAVTVNLSTGRATGGSGNDTLAGIENLVGSAFNDMLTSSAGNNVITAGAGNDIIFGSAGFDEFDGGAGLDTVSYAGLGQAVTLLSRGVIQKAGGLGTDLITGVETIIGATGKANLIDGQVDGPQTTAFNVNLGMNSLQVLGVPGLGTAGFTVQNFVNVRGTVNADTITGSVADNIFFGSAGNDVYNGGAGNDSIDYSLLRAAITLRAEGLVEKAGLGTDTIIAMERIVGAAGVANIIDGRVSGPQTTAFDIDLGASKLVVSGIPGLGTATFKVENFTTVFGTANADRITGGTGPNLLRGGDGADTITGGNGNDSLYGDGGNDSLSGSANNDLLFGGGGNDTINGGAGSDTACYAGFRSDYLATKLQNGQISIRDLRSGAPDGTDTLVNVESFNFANGTYSLNSLLFPSTPGGGAQFGSLQMSSRMYEMYA